jgi:CheY-like chemotaxis protein/HPt (histidine-containing phosphotransfer) domain-containing protein
MNIEKSYRFLVADDDRISRIVLQGILAPFASRIDLACDGEEVLLFVAEHDYDFIFMDVHMPRLNGIESMQMMRELIPSSKMPIVIAITASADEKTISSCFDAGMRDHVAKPMDTGTLRLIINKWAKTISSASSDFPKDCDSELLNLVRIKELKDLQRSASTRLVIDDLIALFRSECPEQIGALKKASESKDFEGLRRICHRLRGSLLNLGLVAAAGVCERIEESGNRRDAVAISKFLEYLDDLYKRSYTEFSQYLLST